MQNKTINFSGIIMVLALIASIFLGALYHKTKTNFDDYKNATTATINDFEQNNSSNDALIIQLRSNIAQLNSSLETTQADKITLQTQVTEKEALITQKQNLIIQLQADATANATQIASLQSDILVLTGDVTVLGEQIIILTEEIAQLSDDLATAYATIATLQQSQSGQNGNSQAVELPFVIDDGVVKSLTSDGILLCGLGEALNIPSSYSYVVDYSFPIYSSNDFSQILNDFSQNPEYSAPYGFSFEYQGSLYTMFRQHDPEFFMALDDALQNSQYIMVNKIRFCSGNDYSITSIADWAFGNLQYITSVDISSGVEEIGDFAFDGCSNLVSAVLPVGLTSIGEAAFANTGLTSIVLPNSLVNLGNGAFGNCSSLTSVVIPNGVLSIPDYAFNNCNSLTTVYYTGSQSEWESITIGAGNDVLQNATINYNYVPNN